MCGGSTQIWVGPTRYQVGFARRSLKETRVLGGTVKERPGLTVGLNQARKKCQWNQNLLWSRIWIGVRRCCYRSLLRDLLQLLHFRDLRRFRRLYRLDLSIYFRTLEFTL